MKVDLLDNFKRIKDYQNTLKYFKPNLKMRQMPGTINILSLKTFKISKMFSAQNF